MATSCVAGDAFASGLDNHAGCAVSPWRADATAAAGAAAAEQSVQSVRTAAAGATTAATATAREAGKERWRSRLD